MCFKSQVIYCVLLLTLSQRLLGAGFEYDEQAFDKIDSQTTIQTVEPVSDSASKEANDQTDNPTVEHNPDLLSEEIVDSTTDESDEQGLGRSILSGRELIGGSYIALTEMLDNLFAGEQTEHNNNNSYLKFLSQGTWFSKRFEEYDNKFKAKLHLPGAQKKYRLFLDSNLSENNSLENRNRSVSTGERVKEERSVAGLEYSKGAGKRGWKTSLSGGAKLNKKLNPFIRMSLKKDWRLSERWSSYFRQDLWYLDGVGWGETSHWELTKSLGEQSRFQLKNEVEWKDEAISVDYVQVWQVEHRFNDDYALNYRIGLIGSGHQSLNYFTNTTLSYRLYQDWVFVYITPEFFLAKDNDYKTEKSITLKMEFFLTD